MGKPIQDSELMKEVKLLLDERRQLLKICDMLFHGGFDERDRTMAYKVYNEIKFGTYKVEDNV